MFDYKILFMKKLLVLFAIAFCLPVFADQPQYTDKQTAVVRIMNKAAGKSYTGNVPVGRSADFEKLSVVVRDCKQTDPYQPENFYMFIEIKKSGDLIFSGWMNRNEPGDNPLQDVDYDLWLVRCE